VKSRRRDDSATGAEELKRRLNFLDSTSGTLYVCTSGMTDLSAVGLKQTDSQLKDVDFAKWYTVKGDEAIAAVKKAFEKHKFTVEVVANKKAALEHVASFIPKGVSVGQAGSTTLNEIGWPDYCKANPEQWNNLHAKKLAETDPAKQADIGRQEMCADYFLSSVSAVTETGTLLACDLTGSRTGAFASTAKHLVLIVSAQKIVHDKNEAHVRQREFCLPMESARVRIVYKVPASHINNCVEIHGASPWGEPGRVHLVIVKELVGY